MATGKDIYDIAIKHVGEQYILGAFAPKNNSNWKGPWDCAEFVSWCVYQAAGILYGCDSNKGNPARADAYTGYWGRDARSIGKRISFDKAARCLHSIVYDEHPVQHKCADLKSLNN